MKTSIRFNRFTVPILAFAVMAILAFSSGCSTLSILKSGFDSPYKIGRRVAGVYYLSDHYMTPETEQIVVLAWKVFDRVVSESPTDQDITVNLMHRFIEEVDIPPEIQPDVAELVFTALNEALDDLPDKLSGMKFAAALSEIHRGITERIADHEKWKEAYDGPPEMRK